MKAVVAGEKGAEVVQAPKPEPGPHEVLIQVRASSLNRADLLAAQRGGGTRLGLECAGEVEAVGGEVTGIAPGDRVLASTAGGFAEYVATDAGRVHRIPANNMTYGQAACLPVALQTMHNARRYRRTAQARRNSADAGRKLGRRPDGHADRKAAGRVAGDRDFDRRGAARAPERVRRRPRARHGRPRLAGGGAGRRPEAKASTSSSTRSPAASPTRT